MRTGKKVIHKAGGIAGRVLLLGWLSYWLSGCAQEQKCALSCDDCGRVVLDCTDKGNRAPGVILAPLPRL